MNDFYIIGNFARSFDQYHLEKNLIHLVGSIFYISNNNILKNFNNLKNCNKKHYIFLIKNEQSLTFNILENSENLVVFEMSFIYLLGLYKNSEAYTNFDGFLNILIGNHDASHKTIEGLLNNVIFFFKSTD